MKSEIKFTISLVVAILFGVIGNAISTGAKTGGHYLGVIMVSTIVFGIAFWLLGKVSDSETPQKIKEPSKMNEPTREKIIQMLEQRLTKVVVEQHEKSPFADSPFEGTAIRHAVTQYAVNYKKEFISGKNRLGLSESEIKEIVDEATSNVLNKFLDF